MIDFRCPGCNASMRVKDERAGTQVVCPRCKTPLVVPSPASIDDLAEEVTDLGESVDLDADAVVEAAEDADLGEPVPAAPPRPRPARPASRCVELDRVLAGEEAEARPVRLSRQDEAEAHRRIAAHFAAVPGHDIGDIGEAEFEKVEELHVYKVQLHSLYERRGLARRSKAHDGQPVPHRSVTEANADLWGYDNEPPAAFKEATEELLIGDSQQLLPCGGCGGQGGAGCSACGGKGAVRCPGCKGGGEAACGKCGGTMKYREVVGYDSIPEPCDNASCQVMRVKFPHLKCPRCGNTGLVHRKQPRHQIVDCPCNFGKVSCSSCHGQGRTACTSCVGSGRLGCKQCKGSGQVVSFLTVVRTFTPATATRTAASDRLPAGAAHGLAGFDSFHPLLDMPVPDADAGVVPSRGTTALREAIAGVFHKAQAQKPGDGRIARQHLAVGVMHALQVTYDYGGQPYSLWLLGDDMQVLAPDSPLTQAVEQKVAEALALWKRGEQRAAALAIRDALDMGEMDAGCQAAFERLRDRIPEELEERGRTATTFGRWIKKNAVLCIVLGVVAFGMLSSMCLGLVSLALRR